MKAYRRLTAGALCLMVLVFLLANWRVAEHRPDRGRGYRVDISRAAEQIRQKGPEGLSLSDYPSLIRVTAGREADGDFLKGGEEEYALRRIDGVLYRFDYRQAQENDSLLWMNLGFLGAALILLGTLLIVKKQVIQPFEQLRELPENLAKGNLTMPLQQQKSRYFGRFLWGMDLLRETLESQKRQELKLQKEKKSLLLSLAHDIKTPLSAIKLYSQALKRNLYRDPDRQREVAENIGREVDEIEDYLEKIVSASREDFLHLEVHNGEFYLREVMGEIGKYYGDKLRLLKIPFSMDWGTDCLMKGDRERAVEIFQNLMENAVKYGDGAGISITSREEGNCRILTVSNSGCTLQEGELPHIFDSFWRGSNSESQQGSGLGLYICRELTRAMGGEIFGKIDGNTMKISAVFKKA